jgi:uncharacterized protein GlcG (DUF336 family)
MGGFLQVDSARSCRSCDGGFHTAGVVARHDTNGAVGTSGSTSEGDENCAEVGAARMADQLK